MSEHVRFRPRMYVGGTHQYDLIYHLRCELSQNLEKEDYSSLDLVWRNNELRIIFGRKKPITVNGKDEWFELSKLIGGHGMWSAYVILAPKSQIKYKNEKEELIMSFSDEHQDLVLAPRAELLGVSQIEINLLFENSYWNDVESWELTIVFHFAILRLLLE